MNPNSPVSLFPNPATHKVSISSHEGIRTITFFTLSGVEVLSKQVHDKQSEVITLGLLPKGLYNVRVITEHSTCESLLYKAS